MDQPSELVAYDPEVFATYLTCVNNKQVTVEIFTRKATGVDGQGAETLLVDTYALPNMLGDLEIASTVIDLIIEKSDDDNKLPFAWLSGRIYKGVPKGNPLRKLAVDYAVHERSSNFGRRGSTCLTFLWDVVDESGRVRQEACDNKDVDLLGVCASERSRCHYHQHDKDSPVCEEVEDEDDESDKE